MRKFLIVIFIIVSLVNTALVAFGENHASPPQESAFSRFGKELAKPPGVFDPLLGPTMAGQARVASAAAKALGIKSPTEIGFSAIGWVTNKVIAKIFVAVNYIIGFIGAIFFNLAALLLQIGLILNANILESVTVKIGWRIVRDITNLGFVIGILVIAFATMLRIETYAMKKTLANLIVVVLLVNFSLAFAGIFLDASHVFTNFFIRKSTSASAGFDQGAGGYARGLDEFASNLANAFSPQAFLRTDDKDFNAFEQLVENFGNFITMIASTFFVALFTLFAAVGMLALAGMTLYRYVVLSILLILLPGALLCWVFPGLKKYWGEWWSNFIAQVVYLPVSVFFIYLAISLVQSKAVTTTGQSFNSLTALVTQGVAGQSFGRFLKVVGDSFLSNVLQMIVVLGILLGGLVAAKKMGAAGASASISFAQGAANFLVGAGARGLGVMGLADTRFGRAFKKVREEYKKTAKVGAGILAPATKLAAISGEKSAAPKKKKEEEEKKLDRAGLTKQYNTSSSAERLGLARNKALLADPLKASALTASLAQNGELDELTPEEFEPLKQIAVQSGDRSLLKYLPHLAPDFGTTAKDIMSGLRPEEVNKISHRSLEKIEVVSELNEGYIEKLGASGTLKQINAVVNTINDNFGKSGVDSDKLKSLVEIIVRGKNRLNWAGAGAEKIRALTEKVSAPAEAKKTDQQIANLEATVKARQDDLNKLRAEGETRPTVLQSAEESLKRAQRELQRYAVKPPETKA